MPEHSHVPDDDEDGLLAHPDDTSGEPGGPAEEAAQGSTGGGGEDYHQHEVAQVRVEGDSPPIEAPAAAVADPGPPPATPASSQAQYDARVRYESGVNAELEAWWERNKGDVLSTLLAGGTVDLDHSTPDTDNEPEVATQEEIDNAADGHVTSDPAKKGPTAKDEANAFVPAASQTNTEGTEGTSESGEDYTPKS